jgi:hypothetical protein
VGRENKPGDPAVESQEDFLERWSRRKLDAQHDNPGAPAGATDTVKDPGPATAEPERVLTDVDMPPIETLDGNSDYAPFLSPGVSDGLRQQALRKLFNQPGYNITDGLNDYDEDFTQFAGLGKVITHEMKRMLQRELEAEKTTATAATERDIETDTQSAAEDASGDSYIEEKLPDEGPEDADTKSSL